MKDENLTLALAALMPSALRHAEKVFSDHYDEIKAALDRNVSHKDLLKILESAGAKMSLSKLKRMIEARQPNDDVPPSSSESAS